jgi:hypothetical protein
LSFNRSQNKSISEWATRLFVPFFLEKMGRPAAAGKDCCVKSEAVECLVDIDRLAEWYAAEPNLLTGNLIFNEVIREAG